MNGTDNMEISNATRRQSRPPTVRQRDYNDITVFRVYAVRDIPLIVGRSFRFT